MLYLPIFIGEDKSKMNLGTAYKDIESCLEFVFDLGYRKKVASEDRMLYSSDDGSYLEVAIIEIV